ncbi:MAG: hypothetical protein ACI8RZ_007590 [Myxococcota bacterium]|jgi:hypothetical protein
MATSNSKIAAVLTAGQATGITWRAGPLNGGGPFGFVDPLPVSAVDTDRMARVEIAEVGEDWVEVLHFVTDEAGVRYRRLIPFHAISAVVHPLTVG